MITDNITALATVVQSVNSMRIGDWITLAAVLVALFIGVASLVQTQMLQKRERKERLINEIIEWAEDIDNTSTTPVTSFGIEQLKAREVNVTMRYANSVTRSISIGTIAKLIFKNELLENVEEARITLFSFMCINHLKAFGVMPSKQGFPETVIQEIEKEITEGKPIDYLWDAYAKKLANSVHDLLIAVNTIKARNVT